MGRLSHLIRLALGRSAFEEPLRDENGEFVLNSHAFDNGAPGYVQQFDSRGHPVNESSERADKALRRAQNEVLRVVGVVRSKHDTDTKLARRHDLSDDELVDLVKLENFVGLAMREIFALGLDFGSWWAISFRSRLVTFRSYFAPSLMDVMYSETRRLGPPAFCLSGLGFGIAADWIRDYRYMFTPSMHRPIRPNVDEFGDVDETPWTEWGLDKLKDVGIFTIEWPIRAHSMLQALGLMPVEHLISWSTFISPLSESPKYLARMPAAVSLPAYGAFCISLVTSPFVLAYIGEQIRESIELRLRFLLPDIIAKPDRADRLSVGGRVGELDTYTTIIPKFHQDPLAIPFLKSRLSFLDQLRIAFPTCLKILTWLRLTSGGDMIDGAEIPEILQAAKYRYGALVRENHRRPLQAQLPDDQLRRMAIDQALSEMHIDPIGRIGYIHEWADDISTATPDPDDLNLSDADVDEMTAGGHALAPRAQMSDETEISPTVPLERLLEPVDLPEANMPDPSAPSTPVPGLSRAPSLARASHTPERLQGIAPRPVRRPTELDEDISAIASSLQNRAATPKPGYDHRSNPKYFRVTTLSTFTGDLTCLCASSFLASMIMLPFDVYYTRRLATAFLASGTAQTPRATSILEDIGPLRPTMGIFNSSTLALTAKVLMTFHLEALAKLLVLSVGSRVCSWMGKAWFLWGRA